MRRIIFLFGIGVGYVLGSRAGRARYEQIKRAARAFRENPAVQEKAQWLQHQAGDAFESARRTVGDKAPVVVEKVREKLPPKMGGSEDSAETEGYQPSTDGYTAPRH